MSTNSFACLPLRSGVQFSLPQVWTQWPTFWSYGKREIGTSQWRNLAHTSLTKSSGSVSPVLSPMRITCHWWDEIRTSPPTHSPPDSEFWFIHGGEPKANRKKTQIEGHSTKYLNRLLQKCQGHEKPGMTERLSQSRGEEMGTMTKCSRLFWTGKEHLRESCVIWSPDVS